MVPWKNALQPPKSTARPRRSWSKGERMRCNPRPAAKDLVKGTVWGGLSGEKKTRNNPKVVCRFCCRFDKRFRSDQASQSRLQSRKSLKSDPSVTIIRKAWTNDPGRLYSGHRVFLKRQSPVSLDVPFDDAVRAIHADPQNKPRMSQNHNSLAYLLNRWPRWSLS